MNIKEFLETWPEYTKSEYFLHSYKVTKLKPQPCLGIHENGWILFCWDSEEHHFECEINDNPDYEWFYSNRLTGETDYWESNSIDEQVNKYLRLFDANS